MPLSDALGDLAERYTGDRTKVWITMPAHYAFFAGAAAMAEQFATGSGPLLEELRKIREEISCARMTAEPR